MVLADTGPALLQAGAQGAAGKEVERRAALAAYDDGRTAEARLMLNRLAPQYPRDFAVQEALGLADAESGDPTGGLPHLKAAIAVRPRDAGANANLGAAYLALHRIPEAVEALRRAAALDSSNAQTETTLGRALYLNKEPALAAEALGRASRLAPEDADVRYDWAVALDASHQSVAAIAVLDGIAASKRTAAVEALWGDVAEHAGRFEQAAQHMQAAAQMDPSEPNLYALTVELLRHWTWRPAGQVADFGLSKYPESERLRFAKGVSLYGDAQFVRAADVFAVLVLQSPDNATYGDLLGRSCAALGGTESPGCAGLTDLAKGHPENPRLAVFAAISILHKPDSAANLGTAEALLRQSLARDPKFAETWYQLGVLQQQREQWEDSAVSLRRATALRPEYAEAHYRLSRAYAHTGNREQANEEMALQKQYAQQEKDASDAQLREVTIFLTDTH
jgi:tetratricopeptide (TPR) repeat protein